MVEENNPNNKYNRNKIILEKEPSKVNYIISPYQKIRETVREIIKDEEE